jgi:hypothetical protein
LLISLKAYHGRVERTGSAIRHLCISNACRDTLSKQLHLTASRNLLGYLLGILNAPPLPHRLGLEF